MENSRNWQVEFQCPQCGGPIIQDESDHILSCPFCRVKHFLSCSDYFRYYMAPSAGARSDPLFLPYWRFKGMSFTCRNGSHDHRVWDSSRLALNIRGLPSSLGVRPQVLRLRFATPETEGRFIQPQVKLNTPPSSPSASSSFTGQTERKLAGNFSFFIGETLSLIYAPVNIENGVLYDSILNRRLPGFSELKLDDLPSNGGITGAIQFTPMICPYCGGDLRGERDTVAPLCYNCDSAWTCSKGSLKKLDFSVAQNQAGSSVYLPFWKIGVQITGLKLQSYADLIRFANVPRAIKGGMSEQKLYFWVPGFKTFPQIFLRLAKQFSVFQHEEFTKNGAPKLPQKAGSILHPVTLPIREAAESVGLTIISVAAPQDTFLSTFHKIKIKVEDYMLVFLPFEAGSSELVQPDIGISVSRNAIKLGRSI